MARVLITGGTGFIGRSLAAELIARGDEVVVFDRGFTSVSNTEHRAGSILNTHDIVAAAQDVDELYHLAGVLGTTELLDEPVLAIDANIKGTLHALDAARINGLEKFFYPTKPNDWLNMYSLTKAAGEDLCRLFRIYHGLDTRMLRWLNIYGPRQKLYPIRKAVPLFILQAMLHLPVEIWGDGSQEISLVHANDLAYVTVEYVKRNAGHTELLDTGLSHTITVAKLVGIIIRLVDSTSEIRHLPMRRGEDIDKTIRMLPTATERLSIERQTIPLEEGLVETIEYYRSLSAREVNRALRFYYGDAQGLGSQSITLGARALLTA
jgi:UDP-glucose 4-epimerase